MKLTEKDIRIYDTVFGDEVLGINIKHSKEKFEQLKQQILENQEFRERVIQSIKEELESRLPELNELERQRLEKLLEKAEKYDKIRAR